MLLHSLLPAELRPDGAVPPDFDFAAERDEFIRYAQRRHLGPSTMSLVRAAEERKIPWIRLNEQSLIQFGHGRYQQRIQATVTSRTSHIAVELASDKEETNRILGNLGLPVPRQRLVQGAEDAVEAAEQIGYPVVVKPFNANHGRGITIHVTTAEDVRDGVRGGPGAQPQRHRRELHHRRGPPDAGDRRPAGRGLQARSRPRGGRRDAHHRAAGGGGEPGSRGAASATRRCSPGSPSITRPRRCCRRKGYTRESVPAAGERVFLRSTGNLSTGGTATDLTDVVHPDNVEMAARAVKAIGLDVGGVDFLSTDITESYKEVGGAICEINAAPGFRMHMAPSEGRAARRRRPGDGHALPARARRAGSRSPR